MSCCKPRAEPSADSVLNPELGVVGVHFEPLADRREQESQMFWTLGHFEQIQRQKCDEDRSARLR